MLPFSTLIPVGPYEELIVKYGPKFQRVMQEETANEGLLPHAKYSHERFLTPQAKALLDDFDEQRRRLGADDEWNRKHGLIAVERKKNYLQRMREEEGAAASRRRRREESGELVASEPRLAKRQRRYTATALVWT